jgi:hypothetical protein
LPQFDVKTLGLGRSGVFFIGPIGWLRRGGFHTRVVAALGITWILDGLEVTLAGALSGALKESPTLQFSNFDVGLANSAYLAGAVLGALGFGWRIYRDQFDDPGTGAGALSRLD